MMPAEPNRRRQWPRELDAEEERILGMSNADIMADVEAGVVPILIVPNEAERRRVYMHIDGLAEPMPPQNNLRMSDGKLALALIAVTLPAVVAIVWLLW